MELINPYAVMRNTATHEAYKAHMRGLSRAGAPLFVAMILPTLWIPLGLLITERFARTARPNLPFVLLWSAAPAILAAVLAVVGVLRIRRYRREHPIPDEWRQVPPIKPLGRKAPVG